MRGIVALILGIGLAANGLIMLVVPSTWYAIVPGVAETGPFNAHFVRDIGVAYLVCGVALAWFALERIAQPAALAAAAFLALHALVHLWDAVAGREHAHQLLLDVPTILLPPVLAFWITLAPGRGPTQRQEKRDDQVVSAAVDR
jgi:hypothetical protein